MMMVIAIMIVIAVVMMMMLRKILLSRRFSLLSRLSSHLRPLRTQVTRSQVRGTAMMVITIASFVVSFSNCGNPTS